MSIIHGGNAVAELKLADVIEGLAPLFEVIHGGNAVAELKPNTRREELPRLLSHPRRQRRGRIEAMYNN